MKKNEREDAARIVASSTNLGKTKLLDGVRFKTGDLSVLFLFVFMID